MKKTVNGVDDIGNQRGVLTAMDEKKRLLSGAFLMMSPKATYPFHVMPRTNRTYCIPHAFRYRRLSTSDPDVD